MLPLTMAVMSAEVTLAVKYGSPKTDHSDADGSVAATGAVANRHVEGGSTAKTPSGDTVTVSGSAGVSGTAAGGKASTATGAKDDVTLVRKVSDPTAADAVSADATATAAASADGTTVATGPAAISLVQRVDVYA